MSYIKVLIEKIKAYSIEKDPDAQRRSAVMRLTACGIDTSFLK